MMAIIDGGKITEAAYLRVITILLSAVIVLGGIVWSRIETAMDTVIQMQVEQGRQGVEISEMKRRLDALEFVRGKQRSELTITNDPVTRFRARGGARDRGDAPRSDIPSGPPQGAPDPKPTAPPTKPEKPTVPRDRGRVWEVEG